MKNLVTVLIIVGALALAVVAIDGAFPTPGERAARDARAAARAASAQAWASQADERAEAVTLFLWGSVALVLLTCAGVGAAVVRMAMIRSGALHPHREHGLYPAILHRGQWEVLSDPVAQQFAALPARPTAAVARALIGTPTATGRGAPAVIDSEAVDVTPYAPRFDLQRAPHFLFAGQTGRGKTTAMWQVTDALARSHDIAWTIAEPGGANWKELATATDIASIAEAIASVHAEMTRRLEVLRASAANHVANLPEPMPYVGFVIEESESVYGDLSLSNRNQAKQLAVQLRQLAAMGRKAGIVLVLGTQTALRVIFDGAVLENVGNVYLFGGAQNLAERFRVSHDVRLPELGPGQAYCPRDNRIVQFARVMQAPKLRLALPAGGTSEAVRTDETAGFEPVRGGTYRYVPDEAIEMPTEPGELSEAQRRAILSAFTRAGSLKGAQRTLYPDQELGGWRFYQIRKACQDAGLV